MKKETTFTIQTDGTSKYGQHFSTYDVATVDTTYALGLRHVFSGSSQNTLDTLKEILDDLDVVQRELGCAEVSSKIVSKLKNSMSDRHAAEKLFNQMLAEYRADILPDVYAGWSELSDKEKEQVTRMNNFFCGLHFLVALADAAEATLAMWESIDTDDGTTCSSSGTQHLVHTACKAFHHRGSEQAGCSTHFRAYLRQKGIHKVPLAAFRGNRFNILFYDAAGVFYLKAHVVDYLKFCHGQLNRLLQAVLSDLSVSKYLAGCKALGIIDKVVTGPLWRHLMQSTTSILEMSAVYTRMAKKFEEWGQDAQGVIERQQHLFDEDHHENDIVADSLFAPTSEDPMVQEVLQLLFKSFTLTVQRLLPDHLPGGVYHAVTDAAIIEETKSVPTTNLAPERDFAVLDRLISQKPNATYIALESVILFSHNKTSEWLKGKSQSERKRLLQAARTLTAVHKSNFRKRREEIEAQRVEAVRRKEREIAKKEREIKEKEDLTKQIQKIGLWTTQEEVEEGLLKLKTSKSKLGALKLQIKFRKKVLCQTHSDKMFCFSHNKKQFSHAELKENLLKLLSSYKEPEQNLTIEEIARDPEVLIYRRIEHMFDCDGELEWFSGTVLSYDKVTKEFRVAYDNEEDEYSFPLLEDLASGEIRLVKHH